MEGMALGGTNSGKGAGKNENSSDGIAPHKNVEERHEIIWGR
jgi:hypothetical protein